jgi:hypothetical protein
MSFEEKLFRLRTKIVALMFCVWELRHLWVLLFGK